MQSIHHESIHVRVNASNFSHLCFFVFLSRRPSLPERQTETRLQDTRSRHFFGAAFYRLSRLLSCGCVKGIYMLGNEIIRHHSSLLGQGFQRSCPGSCSHPRMYLREYRLSRSMSLAYFFRSRLFTYSREGIGPPRVFAPTSLSLGCPAHAMRAQRGGSPLSTWGASDVHASRVSAPRYIFLADV